MRVRRILEVLSKYDELSRFIPFVYLVRSGSGFRVLTEGGFLIFEIPEGRDGYEETINFLHLLGHILLNHPHRGDLFGRNEVWDSACDFAVSNFIYKDIVTKLPPSVRKKFLRYLKPFEKEFLNLSTEEIYLKLIKGGKVPRAADDHQSLSSTSQPLLSNVRYLYREGTHPPPFPGNQPGNYTKTFQLKWTKIPTKFVNTLYTKYTETFVEDFPTPDIPSLGLGRIIYQPVTIPYPHFVFIIDCSDSMLTGGWVETSLSAVWTISNFLINTFSSGKITVLLADTRITNMWSGWSNLTSLKQLLTTVRGFGGTDIISPFFDIKDQLKPPPFCVCIFSDYEFDARLKYPVNEVIQYFSKLPLYVAVTPQHSPINAFYYNIYLKEYGTSPTYIWSVDALKLFKEKLPHVRLKFNEF